MAKQKRARSSSAKRAPQQRTLETRRKILNAAIAAFAADGYEGASTRSIAESAGVMHTLVTYHFDGKEGLWREAIRAILQAYSGRFQQRLDALGGVDDTTKLRLIWEEFVRFSAENLHFHRIITHVAAKPSRQLDWLIDEYFQQFFDNHAALIRSVQKAGHLVDGDPYHIEYAFIGAVTRIFMLAEEVSRISGRSPLDPEFVREHARLCLSLFFRDPSPAHPRRQVSRPGDRPRRRTRRS